MTSFFSGWSAHEIIGPLNKSEVRAALLEYTIEKSHFRTWNSIESFVLSSCDEIKNVLYEAGMAKAKVEEDHRNVVRKRRREDLAMIRNVRRRISKFFQ